MFNPESLKTCHHSPRGRLADGSATFQTTPLVPAAGSTNALGMGWFGSAPGAMIIRPDGAAGQNGAERKDCGVGGISHFAELFPSGLAICTFMPSVMESGRIIHHAGPCGLQTIQHLDDIAEISAQVSRNADATMLPASRTATCVPCARKMTALSETVSTLGAALSLKRTWA